MTGFAIPSLPLDIFLASRIQKADDRPSRNTNRKNGRHSRQALTSPTLKLS
jgi:hypothetical protein